MYITHVTTINNFLSLKNVSKCLLCVRLRSQILFAVVSFFKKDSNPLADPGGAPGARPPPNGRGPMIFYAQNAIFSHFFLRSRLILSIILIEIWPKTR